MNVNPMSTCALLIEGWARRRDKVDEQPTLLSTATGFLIDDAAAGTALITARHVLTGDDARGMHKTRPEYLTVRLPPTPGAKDVDDRRLCIELYDDYPILAAPCWSGHPRGSQVDVAAVPVTLPDDSAVVFLDPAPGPLTSAAFWLPENGPAPEPYVPVRAGVTDRLFVVGWPYGDTGTWPHAVWSTGYISSEPDIEWAGLPAFLLDCRSREGQSGAPVLLHIGPADTVLLANGDSLHHGVTLTRLVGVYSGRVDKDADLGRVFTNAAVREVLAELPSRQSTIR